MERRERKKGGREDWKKDIKKTIRENRLDEKCFVEADYRPLQKNKKPPEITGRNKRCPYVARQRERGERNKNRKAPTTEIPAKPLVKDSDRNQKTEMN